MKMKRFNLGRLFYNNKIVMLFSALISFIFWVILSTSASESTTKLITDIPITVALSESAKETGLTVFGADNIKAEVSVTGNRLILGQLSKNDIQITAQQSANMINSTGKYTLELSAKKNSILTDYEFASSVSPKFVTVVVDRYKSQTFDITPNIKFNADTNYFVAPITLSDPQLTVSGPESLISSIESVTVEASINGILNKTTDLNDLQINLFDKNGNKINTKNLTLSVTKVTATIPILQRKFVSVNPEFTSVPSGLNISALSSQINPNRVEIAAPSEIINNLNNVSTEPIDFSQINLENYQFEKSLKIPSDCRNLSNNYNATVKLNLIGFQTRTINIKNIKFKNVIEDKVAASHTTSLSVQIIGPISQLRTLTDDNIYAEVDLSEKKDFIGRTELPAKIVFNNYSNKCWAFGSYKINATINKK